MQRIFRHALSLLCLVSLMVPNASADTLSVGSKFPEIVFRHVRADRPARRSRLQDVVQDKTIVFIFASW